MAEPQECSRCGVRLEVVDGTHTCPGCRVKDVMLGMLDSGEEGVATLDPSSVDTGKSEVRWNEQFHGYRIEGEIGRGGMGIIYRARHQQVNRVVALKRVSFLGSEASDARARFRAEIEAAATLDHSNIVPIYEVGEHEGEPFFTMKFLEGGTLADRLAKLVPGSAATTSGSGSTTRRRGSTAAAMMIKIAKAVHFAHQHGVLHRDLKPSNILLDAEGEPYVADFGLAKRIDQNSDVTVTGQALGTPAYMSPEQARGRNRELSVATDIFSLGAIFYHLLTGHRPFVGESAVEVMKSVMDDDPIPPTKRNRHVEADLATICLKCLDKQPDLRYQSAEEFAADLELWQNREPIRARPATSIERVAKWVRRKPTTAGFVFTSILLVLVMGIGGPLVAWQQAQSKQAAQEAGELAQSRGDELEETLYAAEMVLAGNELNLTDSHRLVHALTERWIPKPGNRDLRGWEWHFLRNEAEADLSTVYQSDSTLHAGDLSPDGHWIAVGNSNGIISVVETTTGNLIKSFQAGIQPMAVAFNSDATRLAVGNRYGETWLFDLEQDRLLWKKRIAKVWLFDCAWSPDGSQIVFSGGMRDLVVLRAEDGRQDLVLKGHGHDVRTVRWTKQHGIVSASRDRSVRFWNTAEQCETRRIRPDILTRVLTISPDGHQLAVGGYGGKIAIIDIASGKSIQTFDAHRIEVVKLDWDANSGLLLSASWDQTAKIWNPKSGQLQLTVRGHGKRIEAAYWTPDGSRIATISKDGAVKLWDANRRRRFRLPKVGVSARLKWNAKGTLLASGHGDSNELMLFDLKSWSIRRRISVKNRPRAIDWHPHADTLAVLDQDAVISICDGNGDIQRRIAPGDHRWKDVAWSPDGKRIALLAETGQLRMLNADTGEPIWKQDSPRRSVHSLHWYPDGNRLAFGGRPVRIANAADGLWEKKVAAAAQSSLSLRSIDGALTFAGAALQDETIHVWTEDGIPTVWTGHSLDLTMVDWHPSQPRLASSSLDGTVRIWNARTGARTLILRDHSHEVMALAWSRDGRYLASVDRSGELRIRDGTANPQKH